MSDDVEESIEPMGSTSKDVCDEMLDDKHNKEEKKEEDYKNNDHVKKYQFQ